MFAAQNIKHTYIHLKQINMHAILKFKHDLLFAVIFFLISLCNVSAQQECSSKNKSKKEFFVFGPKLSVNFTQDNLFSFTTSEFVPGADLGLFFRFNIARFYIQPEVNYVIRRHNLHYYMDWWGAEIKMKEQTNYIGVPLLVGFRVIDFRNFKLRTFAGPEFNFALREHSNEYFQLGFQIGVGVDVWRFTVDAGYSFLAYTGRKKTNSNVFKVGVGFKCF